MSVKIEVPVMGESINEAIVARWVKNEGDYVNEDELVAELETDKVNLEVTAPKAGKLIKIMTGEGNTVATGDIMAEIDETASVEASEPSEKLAEPDTNKKPVDLAVETPIPVQEEVILSPAVRRLVSENNLDTSQIKGTGKGSRITKEDVINFMDGGNKETTAVTTPTATPVATTKTEKREERVKMSNLRKIIAGRLKTSQNNAAMLTTYNEVDLSEVMALRAKYKDTFLKQHDVKLGFMSFFTKAVIEGLKAWPSLNAEIDGDEIVYKHYYDIGVAVSTPKGLVVPVVRDADKKSFAEIEASIMDYALRARDGKLMPDEMAGGTFTITNGGVFGSMMSMPILNYPQVGILGMHAINKKPVVVDDEIVIRPMMYLAMTYDHRIVDGREAVSFLKAIKESLETPSRMLIGV